MALVTVLVLALCLSADGLGVGFSYGVKGVRVPPSCVAVVSAISAATFSVSAAVGAGIEQVVGGLPARVLGAAILAGLGIWLIRDALRGRAGGGDSNKDGTHGTGGDSSGSGLVGGAEVVWAVVREPETADLDRSGSISVYEAALLGLALAVDAAGAGAGATLAGSPPWWSPLVVAVVNAVFLVAGLWLGRITASKVTEVTAGHAPAGYAPTGYAPTGYAPTGRVPASSTLSPIRGGDTTSRLAMVQAYLPGLALILVALLDLVV